MSELKRLERTVRQKAAAVERDKALTSLAFDRTLDRFKQQLSRPVTLLGLFGAGLVFGFLHRGGRGDRGDSGGDEDGERRRPEGGMLTRTAAVLLSAARLIELTRNADRFGQRRSRSEATDVPPQAREDL
ncbi:MAG: hypothetical protein JXB36_10810 [Gammaproteobacteria bacterium]|nr:hypothetical protein [Gammaproteobacteria bacterium]